MYYALKHPDGTKAYDYWLLKQAHLARKFYVGTYYIPSKRLYAPVFKALGKADPGAFVEVSPSELRKGYKMICIKGCGQCCERDSGAVIMESEAEDLGIEIKNKPGFTISLIDGTTEKVYRLDTRKNGQCVFFNRARRSCALGRRRPALCMITYCGAFAERSGKKYVRVSGKFLPRGEVEMVFEQVSPDEWEELERLVKSGTNVWRAVAEVLRRRNITSRAPRNARSSSK
ncbi:MAG: YkgJ family cysteine cluster protein [Crenarchaeota archaeon]|nr:YkgJ family cysteine cluster protein [Thermoproteota archaeon]